MGFIAHNDEKETTHDMVINLLHGSPLVLWLGDSPPIGAGRRHGGDW